MSKVYAKIFGYVLIDKKLTNKLEKENEYKFKIRKLVFRMNQFAKGYYLHRFNKPNQEGLKGTFKLITNNKQKEKEKDEIIKELKNIANET